MILCSNDINGQGLPAERLKEKTTSVKTLGVATDRHRQPGFENAESRSLLLISRYLPTLHKPATRNQQEVKSHRSRTETNTEDFFVL